MNRITTKQIFELDFDGLGFLPWLEIFKALSEKDVILLLRVVVLVTHRPAETKQYGGHHKLFRAQSYKTFRRLFRRLTLLI